MRAEARSQKSEAGMPETGKDDRDTPKRLAFRSGLLLTSVFWLLTPAIAGTHVTGAYNLGANPVMMTTVNGTPEYGLVFVQRNKSVNYNNVEYGPQILNGYLGASGNLNDGAGNLWLDLIPNLTASPSDSYYVVTINIQGSVHAEIWVVPDVATVDAASVRQSQPPTSTPPSVFYQLVQQSGTDLTQRPKLNFMGTGVSCSDNNAQLSTDCAITAGTGGSGSAPIASATISGTVKTDSTVVDPVVYLTTTADSLLAGKVPASRLISTAAPLAGGGSLASNLMLSIPAASGAQNGYLSSSDWSAFNSKENALSFSTPLARSVNTISCPTCEVTGNKNAASGYAGLTATAKLTAAQGQEVWALTDLTGVSGTSGSGSTAILSTITTPADAQCLTWNAASTNWVNGSCAGGSSNHNLLSATHPDTLAASPVLGDVIFANSTPAWAKLVGNITTAKKFLNQTGTGAVSAAPSWDALVAADIPALDAGKITTGTFADAFLASAYSGVGACAANNWASTLTRNAAPTCTQPGFSNLSGTATKSQLPATTVYTDQTNTYSTGTQDFESAAVTRPFRRLAFASFPGTCTANREFLERSDPATAGQVVYVCNAAGTGWDLVGDGGAGGGASTADAFITVGHPADLTAERNLAGTTGEVSVTDGGANNDITLALPATLSTVKTVSAAWDFTGGPTATKTNILTTPTDAFKIQNTTVSDATNTLQYSPALRLTGHVWNTTAVAADNAFDWRIFGIPTSGTTPTHKLSFQASLNGGAFTERMSLSDGGLLTIGTAASFDFTIQGNGAQAANITWTLPAADASGFLRSDGAGALSLAAAGGTGSCTNQFVRAINNNAAPTCATVGTADVAAALNTRSITYIAGADNASAALADADDQATIFRNNLAAMTITEVWCESDAGTPSINLQRDDGTPANILSAGLTCTTTGATGTIDLAEDNLAVGDKIDFVMVTAGGTAKRVTVAIKATID